MLALWVEYANMGGHGQNNQNMKYKIYFKNWKGEWMPDCKTFTQKEKDNPMKKLVTVMYSHSIEVDLPENATIESLTGTVLGSAILAQAFDDACSEDCEITDIQEIEE